LALFSSEHAAVKLSCSPENMTEPAGVTAEMRVPVTPRSGISGQDCGGGGTATPW